MRLIGARVRDSAGLVMLRKRKQLYSFVYVFDRFTSFPSNTSYIHQYSFSNSPDSICDDHQAFALFLNTVEAMAKQPTVG